MKVAVIGEYGHSQAMLGLSLNKKQPVDKMPNVAERLSGMDYGHNKFLESIGLWIDIIAPMYWWKQFDTYRVGVSKQSESTMHTVLITKLKDEHFEGGLEALYLKYLNMLRERGDFETLIRSLPQSFIQRRIVHMNYKSLRNMYFQRKNHKLIEWRKFLNCMLAQIDYPEYITKDNRRIEKEDC